MRARSRTRGYTVVEVISAMTLFAIGASGVISMQRVTMQGGDSARRMDVGTNVANGWSSRLQRDAAFWTLPSAADPNTNNINETAWLRDVPATGTSAWLTSTDPRGSGSFDLWGRERWATTGDHIFCAQHRLGWLTAPGTAAPFLLTALLRTEVRVFWARLEHSAIGNCAALPVDPDSAAGQTYYHFVYVTSAVRTTASQ